MIDGHVSRTDSLTLGRSEIGRYPLGKIHNVSRIFPMRHDDRRGKSGIGMELIVGFVDGDGRGWVERDMSINKYYIFVPRIADF